MRSLTITEDDNDDGFNVYVVSLPRSGSTVTSSICQILGVHWIHSDSDEECEKRKFVEEKRYETEEWTMQPGHRFMEVTKNIWSSYMELFLGPKRGCKMISPLNPLHLGVVKFRKSKVLLMQRDPEEVRQSQEASYSRDEDFHELAREKIRTMQILQREALRRNGIDFMEVSHRELMTTPSREVTKICNFIEGDRAKLAEAIDYVKPSLYRFQSDEVEV